MAESKIALFILNMLLPPMYIYAFIVNIDNIKSTILFILALIFSCVRFYFYVIKEKQMTRKRDMELEQQAKDLSKE